MPLYCTALEREVERKVEKEFEKRGMTFLARESLYERLKSLECIKFRTELTNTLPTLGLLLE